MQNSLLLNRLVGTNFKIRQCLENVCVFWDYPGLAFMTEVDGPRELKVFCFEVVLAPMRMVRKVDNLGN